MIVTGRAIFRILGLTLLMALGLVQNAHALNTVEAGKALYENNNSWGGASFACVACHFGVNSAPNSTQSAGGVRHPFAANSPLLLTTAFATGGFMVGQSGNVAFNMNADDAIKLSLYIGQFMAPAPSNSTIAVRANSAGVRDVYALLPQASTIPAYPTTPVASGVAQTGGVSATQGTNGSTSVNVTAPASGPIAYNLTYTPATNFAGNDSFTYTLANPFTVANPSPNYTKTISVTVYGITNAPLSAANLTATAQKGVNSANWFTVTSNDPGAQFSSSNLTALTGLTISAGGVISGTPTVTGAIDVTVTATTPAVGGSVNRTLTITIAGVTTATSVNYSQNTAITPLALTSFPTAVGSVTISGTLPNGLSVAGSTLSGTPTQSGTFNVTINANAGGTAVSQGLTISVGPIPVITSSPTSNVAPTVTVIGSSGAAISNIQINASTPPALNVNPYIATGIAAITGLNFSAATGIISGTPSVSGDFPVTLGASNVNGQGTLNVVFRVNAGAAPNISSAATAAAVSVGSTGTVYTITTNSNGPIVSYGIVAPSLLPAGLSLDPATGVVSGTPTTSGTFQTTLSATNSGNFMGTKVVTFTINPTTAPVITSPTFASLAAGVPMTPIQIVATNPPILSYGIQAGSALPAGLTLDAVTGIISGTPTAPGAVTTILKATNAISGGVLSVPFTVGVPAPASCAMTVPLNTTTALDLKPCMFPAFVPAGVSILATPSHGTVVVSGTTVTYTPVRNYFGTDSFTAVASFAGGGTSTAGLVSVTVTGRPDPTKDTVVTDSLKSQNAAVLLFSNAQLANFSQRMDSLHSPGSGGSAGPRLQYKSAPESNSRVLGTGNSAADRGAIEPTKMPVVNPLDPQPAPQAISKAQGLDAVATGLGLKALPFAESVASLITTGTVNLASLVGSNGLPDANGSTSYWVEGIISFGNRDASGGISGYEFSSSGISIGMDRRINDTWAVGFGLGYGRDKTIIGTDGSQNDGRGLSLAGYASYQPSPGYFIDGMLGVGSIGFDSRRYVAPINDFAYSNRKGAQIFGSLAGSYEWRKGTVSVSPYGRINYSNSKLMESTETGAGAYALTYFEQTIESLQGVVGARAESIHAASFGWVVPRVRVEFRHEFRGDSNALISYADQIGGPQFSIPGTASGRDSVALGIGSDFIMRDGWKLGIDYQLTQASAQESSYSLRLRLTKDFDAKGLPKLIGDEADAVSRPIDVQVDAGYVFDDNVTRAKEGPDKRSDSSYSVNVSKTSIFDLTEQSRFVLTGSIGGERFQSFNGLSHLSLGVEGEYQYRESSEFDAPTFGLFGRLTAEQFQSDLRDGYRYSLGISVRQPLTDRISLFAALSHNERRANSAVFNTSDNSIKLNADYALSERETLYVSGEYRKGDIVSTGRASLENVSIARVFVQDDAFLGGQTFSYRFDGSTVLTTIGYNLGLGSRDSLDFAWRRVESTPTLRPSFVTSPKSYVDNQLSVTYLMRF